MTACVELVARYLHRIATYDRRGIVLTIPLINVAVFEETAASDERRAKGLPLGPLEGIPYTVKDSYKVKGMTVAPGSLVFVSLIDNEYAFTLVLALAKKKNSLETSFINSFGMKEKPTTS